MIKFNCEGCGVSLKANDDNAGNKMPCPNCNKAVTVPGLHTAERSPTDNIRFNCSNCGGLIQTAANTQGRRVDCPKCQVTMTVPGAAQIPARHNPDDNYFVDRRDRADDMAGFAAVMIFVAGIVYSLACAAPIFIAISNENSVNAPIVVQAIINIALVVVCVPFLLSILHGVRLLSDIHAVQIPRKTDQQK